MSAILNLSAILPGSGYPDAMGRNRYQRPSVMRTHRKDGNDRWFFRYRIDELVEPGKSKRIEKTKALGLCKEMTKREAEKLRDQVLQEVVNQPLFVLQSQIPFGHLLDQFLQVVEREVRSHTFLNYESVVDCHVRPAFGTSRLCDMTPRRCQEWLTGLAPSLSRDTRRKILSLFRQIWDRAIEWGYTREVCPLRRATLGPIEAGREKTLPTVEQFRAILQALDEPYRGMLLVATFTGLRSSEILGLQWGDISDGSLQVRRSINHQGEVWEPKSHKSRRRVPIAHIAGALSKPADAKMTDFIFPVAYQTGLYHLKSAAKLAGIEYVGFGWHTFRRVSVTWSKRAGASTSDSMEQHGHSDARTNQLYVIEDDVDFRRRAEVEARIFDAVMFGGAKEGRA